MRKWLRGLQQLLSGSPSRQPRSTHLSLEALEDRLVLSGTVLQTNLVSDLPNVAQIQDPFLVNPWGISESGGSAFWISDNNAGVSSLYTTVPGSDGLTITQAGVGPGGKFPASIPTPGDPLGSSGTPDGTVFNTDGGAAGGFKVSNGTKSASAIFLFATEDGTLVGWNPGINPVGADTTKLGTYSIIAVDNSGNNATESNPNKQTGAVYKGLAIGSNATGAIFGSDSTTTTVLYASNFRSGQVEVYDPGFNRVTLPKGAFTDPNLPKGFAPFNVQVLNGKVYVTYAEQDAAKHDDVAGNGNGFVDVYNLDGSGETRLASRGALNSPWGLAIAPAGFGGLTAPNSDPVLLVGNFGDGRINAFDATTGAALGRLNDPDGDPIQIDGLWALQVGNGKAGGANNAVYFTAGLFGESHGLFGALSTAAPGSAEGNAELQFVIAAQDVVQLDLKQLSTDLAGNASRDTIKADFKTLVADEVQLLHIQQQFNHDVREDLGIPGHHHHDHHDDSDMD